MVVIFGYTVNFTVCRVERDRDEGILIGGRRDKFYGSRIGSRSLQEAFLARGHTAVAVYVSVILVESGRFEPVAVHLHFLSRKQTPGCEIDFLINASSHRHAIFVLGIAT